MLKRIILLCLLSLLVLCCVTSVIVLKNPQWFTQNNTVQTFFTPSSLPTKPKQQMLILTTLSPTLVPRQSQTIQVLLISDDKADKPELIQLEIAYDPRALLDVTITPGDFFINPTVLLNIINQKTGRISYALQTTEGPTAIQNTHVANISFTPNPIFSGKQTTITFLDKTTIQDTTNNNILTEKKGITLFFATNSAVLKQ